MANTTETATFNVKSNIGEVSKDASSAAAEFRVMGVSLNGVKAGLVSVGTTAKAMFGTIKAGLISTGIGALVVLIGSLVTWFTKTKVGAEALSRAFAAIGAAVAVLTDRISAIGGAIVKVFSGDFKGAVQDIKGAMVGIGDEIARELKLAIELERKFQEIADSERELNVERAEANKIIAKARLDAEDETKSLEERMAALQTANEAELRITQKALAIQKEKLETKRQEVAMGESLAADLDALNVEETKFINMQTASFMTQKRLATALETLRVEARAKQKARENARLKRLKEIADADVKLHNETIAIKQQLYYDDLQTAEEVEQAKLFTALKLAERDLKHSKARQEKKDEKLLVLLNKFAGDKQKIIDKYIKIAEDKAEDEATKLLDIQNKNATNLIENLNTRVLAEIELQREKELKSIEDMDNASEMKIAINEKYNQKVNEQNTKAADEQIALDQSVKNAKLNIAGQTFGLISELAGEGTKVAKAAAVAQATISGVQGVQSAFTTASLSPITLLNPSYPFIQAGLAGAFSAVQIAKILSGTPASSSSSGGGGVQAQTPAPQMMSGAFTLGNGDQEPMPMRAYVVTDEMTNSQNQLANIRRRATI
jgi:hypothetical protein